MTTTNKTAPRTWIITGASSGLGLALATAALEAGENVLGTARRIERFAELATRFPDTLRTVQHDVRDTSAAPEVIERAIAEFGRVEVLVNNAGGGQVGTAEEISDEALRDMLEQHLFGPAALMRAVLPHMREHGAGSIVQMSSQGGRLSFPAVGSYSAGKFALEGWSEALAGEVAPFGIRVLVVEPSRFRTGFNDGDVLRIAAANPDYDSVTGAIRTDMAGAVGTQEGDPVRAAEVIRRVLDSPDAPLRLPVGAEAVRRISDSYRKNLAAVEAWAEVSARADFPDAPASVRPV